MGEWSVWVLDHGLPEPPRSVDRDQSVPVARWVGPRFGAVLHVRWFHTGGPDEDFLAADVQVFHREGDRWAAAPVRGGTDWHEPPFERPPWSGPRAVEFMGDHRYSGVEEAWAVGAVHGVAGCDAAWVEVIDGDGATRHRVESRFGAFVACSDGRELAMVRVLDGAGEELGTYDLAAPVG